MNDPVRCPSSQSRRCASSGRVRAASVARPEVIAGVCATALSPRLVAAREARLRILRAPGATRTLAALLSLASCSLNANPLARGGRFEAWPGAEPDLQAFVLPLGGQTGVALDRYGDNAARFGGISPWFSRIDLAMAPRYEYDAPDLYSGYSYVGFDNPLAAFGGAAAGTPLHCGPSFDFGFHAGAFFDIGAGLGRQPRLRVRAYASDVLRDSPTNGVLPAAETIVPIPVPPGRISTAGLADPAWRAFVSNQYRLAFECADLRSTLRLVDGDSPDNRWGLVLDNGYALRHEAVSDRYVYLVEQSGDVVDLPYLWPCAINPDYSTAFRPLYALEFEHRPPWRSIDLGRPQFRGEPLPEAYQGKSVEDLARARSALPGFAEPPDAAAALVLDQNPELRAHPELDRFVEELRSGDPGRDALAFLNYALNEIELTDALAFHDDARYETNSINAGGVNRGALGVLMEGQGSPAEICAFLVYCLRRAGIPAVYAIPQPNSVRMLDSRVAALLRMQIVGAVDCTGRFELATAPTTNLVANSPRAPALVSVHYPWVAARVPDAAAGGTNRWVHLFPWLADTEVAEGHDLYSLVQPASAADTRGVRNAMQWVDRYVRGDASLLALADVNTPAALFPGYIEERLRANHPAVAPDQIGVRIRNRKHHFTRFEDLPTPFSVSAAPGLLYGLGSNAFDTVRIEILEGDALLMDSGALRTADLHNRKFLVRQEKAFPGTWSAPPATNSPACQWNFGAVSISDNAEAPIENFGLPSATTKVRVWVDDNGGDFDVSEWDGDWGDDFSKNNPSNPFRFKVRFAPSGPVLGYRQGVIKVKCYRASGDVTYAYSVQGFVEEPPRAALSLILAPHRPSETGVDSGGAAFGAGNPLLRKQVRTALLADTDQTLWLRLTHRRHRSFDPAAPPPAAAAFLDPDETVEVVHARPFARGDLAAICMNPGRVTPRMLQVHAEEFWRMERALDADPSLEGDPEVFHGTPAFLLGMNYYHRVSRFDETLARLHKYNAVSRFAFGLSRLNAHRIAGRIPDGQFAPVEPSVDMFFHVVCRAANHSLRPDHPAPAQMNYEDYLCLSIADISAQEHHAIDAFFRRSGSVSTVKLLQLSATGAPGLVCLDRLSYQSEGERVVNGAKLKDHDPAIWKEVMGAFADPATPADAGSVSSREADYSRVWMTPGAVSGAPGPDGEPDYRGAAALILRPGWGSALISGNAMRAPQNGGFSYSFDPAQLAPPRAPVFTLGFVGLQGEAGFFLAERDSAAPAAGQSFRFAMAQPLDLLPYQFAVDPDRIETDVFQDAFAAAARLQFGVGTAGSRGAAYLDSLARIIDAGLPASESSWYGGVKASLGWVFDPVNIFTGEFYIDAVDLALAGPFPLEIRRNYGSHNLVPNPFGVGWKPADFPFIGFTADGALAYAAELDGSVIAYRRQATNDALFLPAPADNPQWSNERDGSPGGPRNLMNNRLVRAASGGITNYTLLGSDGGRREFRMRSFPIGGGTNTLLRARPYLDRWLDHAGNACWFHFGTNASETDYGQLRRIENSAGGALGFHYDTYGRIVEAYATDGRRVRYEYDEFGDLVAVTRPDGSALHYEYLHGLHTVSNRAEPFSHHLVIREEKPGGRLLLNAYDALRRVTNQSATVGADLVPVRNATFLYSNDFDPTNRRPVSGATVVLDAYDRPTVYGYAAGLVTNIEDALHLRISREWFGDGDASPGAYPRSLKLERDKRGLVTERRYDARGNVTNIAVTGDLTGDGQTDEAFTSIVCDANDLPVAVVGPLGHVTVTTYGDTNFPRLATAVETFAPGGALIRRDAFAYGAVVASSNRFARGLLVRATRADGSDDAAVSEWAYDAAGHPVAQTNHTGTADPAVVVALRYNARGELVESRDTAGRAEVFDYDAMGRRTWHERRDPSGAAVWWTGTYFNENGEIEWIDGPRYYPEDFIWRTYDGAGRPREETRWRSRANASRSAVESPAGDALYATTSFTHDLFGNLVSILDPRGHLAAMEYDALGRLTARRHYEGDSASPAALRARESFAYEPGGGISAHTNALGGVTLLYYTSDGKPRQRRNPDGTTESCLYRLDGRVARETHPDGSFTEYDYDDAARTVATTLKSPESETLKAERAASDRRGNVIAVIDAEGHATTTTYDGLDRVKSVTGPPATPRSDRQVTTHFYDAAGVTAIAQNALGERTVTISDAIGRPVRIEVRDASGALVRLTRFEYSADHHGVTTIEGSGAGAPALTNSVCTDVSGRTVLVLRPDGTERWDYDAAGLPLRHEDALARATTFTHDGLGRLASRTFEENGTPRTERFLHDPAGNLTARLLPGGLAETNAFDSAGRLVFAELVAPDGARSERRELAYHASGPGAGQVASITDASGVSCAVDYDAFGRPVRRSWSGPLPEHALTRTTVYDRRGIPTGWQDAAPQRGAASAVSRTLDAHGRTTDETISLNGATIGQFAQTWDAAGRRSSLECAAPESFAWTFAHRADGVLTNIAAAGRSFSFAYGDNGLLLGRARPGSVESIERDPRGRFAARRYARPTGPVLYEETGFSWNPDDTLASVQVDGASRMYVHDSLRRLTLESRTGHPPWHHYASQYDALGLGIRIAHAWYGDDPPDWTADWLAWYADVTDANALGQSVGLRLGGDRIPVPVEGRALGAGKVRVMLQGVCLGLALAAGPFDAEGRWQLPGPARLFYGDDVPVVALATHPGGTSIATATNSVDVSAIAPSVAQAFDAMGCVTNRSWSNGSTRAQSLRWDALGRLVAVSERIDDSRGFEWSADYDPLGRRIRTTTRPVGGDGPDGSVIVDSLFDPEVEFLEIATHVTASTSAQTAFQRSWKIHGPDLDGTCGGLQGTGGLEAIVENDAATECLHDFAGNLVGALRPDGSYTPKTLACTAFAPPPDAILPGINPGIPLADATHFRGRRADPTGFFYWGARHYDPDTAAFLSPDPLGLAAGFNRYAFCLNNPLLFHDPDGRVGKQAVIGATAGDFATVDTGWAGIVGQTGAGFLPIYGQIGDVRDTLAAVSNLGSGGWKTGGTWLGLGAAAVAWVPGFDWLKGVDNVAHQLNKADNLLPSPGALPTPHGGSGWTPSGGGTPVQMEFDFVPYVERQTVARDFYQSAGWSDAKISSHMQGIDFNQPVDVVAIPRDTSLTQHGFPGQPTGNYFATPGTPALGLGIYPHGRVEELFETTADVRALRSTAAEVTDRWSVPGWAIDVPGGNQQLFIPNKGDVRKLP